KVEESNLALARFQTETGVQEVDDNQNTVTQNTATQKVADLNKQLLQAQAERITLEAFLKGAQGNGAALPQVHDNPVIQLLSGRLIESRAQLAQALAVYGRSNSN